MSDLAAREELRCVVLSAIMFMTQPGMMRKVDRSIPKALLIDEAWQMLKGGSMAEFVETYARTCRKYGARCVTATQSLNDYYKSDGAHRGAREQRLVADPPAEARDDRRLQEARSLRHGRPHRGADPLAQAQRVRIFGRLDQGARDAGGRPARARPLSRRRSSRRARAPSPRSRRWWRKASRWTQAIERIAFPDNPEKWAMPADEPAAIAAE